MIALKGKIKNEILEIALKANHFMDEVQHSEFSSKDWKASRSFDRLLTLSDFHASQTWICGLVIAFMWPTTNAFKKKKRQTLFFLYPYPRIEVSWLV